MCAYLIEMSVLSPEILLSLAACVLLMIGAFTKSTCFRVLNATVAVVVAVASSEAATVARVAAEVAVVAVVVVCHCSRSGSNISNSVRVAGIQ